MSNFLYKESGLLGVSKISNDMQQLLLDNSPLSKLAVDLFCYKAATEIMRLTVSLNGCDVIIFTAGIGENAPQVRSKICNWLNYYGIILDTHANEQDRKIISKKDSKIIVAKVATNEEEVIVKHTKNLLA